MGAANSSSEDEPDPRHPSKTKNNKSAFRKPASTSVRKLSNNLQSSPDKRNPARKTQLKETSSEKSTGSTYSGGAYLSDTRTSKKRNGRMSSDDSDDDKPLKRKAVSDVRKDNTAQDVQQTNKRLKHVEPTAADSAGNSLRDDESVLSSTSSRNARISNHSNGINSMAVPTTQSPFEMGSFGDAIFNHSPNDNRLVVKGNNIFEHHPSNLMECKTIHGTSFAAYSSRSAGHIGYLRLDPGGVLAPVKLKKFRLNYVIISGTVTFSIKSDDVDEQLIDAGIGDLVRLNMGVIYAIKNKDSYPAVLMFSKRITESS